LPTVDNTIKSLIGTVNFKGRAFYWAYTVAGFWYAAAGAFQGNLSYFPLDNVFHKGGYVVQIITWSRDSGDGVDDLCAVLSNTGEILVYQGLGPDILNQWELVGRFSAGRPLSVRSHGKLASTEIVINTDGFNTMDELIVNQRTQELQTFAGKIFRAAAQVTSNGPAYFGWEAINYPRSSMFLINVPLVADASQTQQYVVNTNTNAWCSFTGWNARTFCVFNDRLYFGDINGGFWLADTSGSDTPQGFGDNGLTVVRDCTQAYMQLNQPGAKSQVTTVELITNMTFPTKASIYILSDYNARNLPALAPSDTFSTTYWDTSLWDTFYWGDPDIDLANLNPRPVRYSANGYGFALALSYRYSFRAQRVVWFSTNIIFKPGGV